MIVEMHRQVTVQQIQRVVEAIGSMGLIGRVFRGRDRTSIAIVGKSPGANPAALARLPGVVRLVPVETPYKLAGRQMHPDDTLVQVNEATIGPRSFTIIAGPCSVETEDLLFRAAEFLRSRGIRLMRGGAFKPRSSPYSFQGLEHEGLRLLDRVREKTGIGIVTEVMDGSHVEAVEQVADILQVGTRNMQNFTLLKRLAKSQTPILLKRGMAAKLNDWLMAAEYLLAGGNANVVLCERGVSGFGDHTRNTLDVAVVPAAKEATHLPIIVDPSHATGNHRFVQPMAAAAMAAGADGLLVEVHPEPPRALCDGSQSLNFNEFDRMLDLLRRLAEPLGRTIDAVPTNPARTVPPPHVRSDGRVPKA